MKKTHEPDYEYEGWESVEHCLPPEREEVEIIIRSWQTSGYFSTNIRPTHWRRVKDKTTLDREC